MHSSIFLFSFIPLYRGVPLDMASSVIYPDFFLKILHCYNQIHFSTDSSNIFLQGIYYFSYTKSCAESMQPLKQIPFPQSRFNKIASQAKGLATLKANSVWVLILLNSKRRAEDSYPDLSPISRQIFIKNQFLGLSLLSKLMEKNLYSKIWEWTNLEAPGYPVIEQSHQP